MGPGLQLSQRLTQSLVLAPQLQQSLALLQAPTLELKALVAAELEQNPVLEEVPEHDLDQREKSSENDEGDTPEVPDFAEPPEDVKFDTTTEKNSGDPVDDFQAEFEKLVHSFHRRGRGKTAVHVRLDHGGNLARAASRRAGARHEIERGRAGHRRTAHWQH